MTAEQLRAARATLGLTQREVADALHVSERQYRTWEREGPPDWVAREAATMIHRLHDAAESEDT